MKKSLPEQPAAELKFFTLNGITLTLKAFSHAKKKSWRAGSPTIGWLPQGTIRVDIEVSDDCSEEIPVFACHFDNGRTAELRRKCTALGFEGQTLEIVSALRRLRDDVLTQVATLYPAEVAA